jgi:cation diffusion facilitator CzcD-associated flavoprotein CzcO
VDGREVVPSETLVYRGMMFSDVPNLAIAVGYTNASWTLKCDLTSEFVCRVVAHMRRHGHRRCVPHNEDPAVTPMPLLDFTSGYVLRDVHRFPRQGSRIPWRVYQNYALDRVMLRHAPLNDGALRFS